MIVQDAELSNYGKMLIGDVGSEECEFCDRSMVSRFGGIVGTNECPSCSDDFHRQLKATGGRVEFE